VVVVGDDDPSTTGFVDGPGFGRSGRRFDRKPRGTDQLGRDEGLEGGGAVAVGQPDDAVFQPEIDEGTGQALGALEQLGAGSSDRSVSAEDQDGVGCPIQRLPDLLPCLHHRRDQGRHSSHSGNPTAPCRGISRHSRTSASGGG